MTAEPRQEPVSTFRIPPYDPCPVCEGAGGWDRMDGTPRRSDEPGRVRCMACEGTGRRPDWLSR